jgi:hypothetical protein
MMKKINTSSVNPLDDIILKKIVVPTSRTQIGLHSYIFSTFNTPFQTISMYMKIF